LTKGCGYSRKKVPEDGDCFYRSVVDAFGGGSIVEEALVGGVEALGGGRVVGEYTARTDSAILALRDLVAQSVTSETLDHYVMEARM
jgi:hypothetical protein